MTVADLDPAAAPGPGLDFQVLVVGGGPTGLTAANLLGRMGVPVLLLERNETTSNDAKAISLDDESLRSLQLADLDQAIYPIIVPGTGTKYYGARGQVLVHARGVRGPYRFGHPFKNPFAQPAFERVLRDGLNRYPHVRQLFATSLVGLGQRDDAVRVQFQSEPAGPLQELDVRYVLACDGGRSTVRDLLAIPMTGRSFDEVWLVADTVNDPHDERYGMHHGDPDRPHVIVPGRGGRCRYEFLLKPGEGTPDQPPSFELIRDLVRPYRALAPDEVERAVNYRFHALLADRLRQGCCFLLGDAAHMMPPFAGQGLNSGIRDAVNLSWKIAAVLAGEAGDSLLDSYDVERRPHAQAMIELSVRLGRVVMTTDRRRARLRDLGVRAAMTNPVGRRYFTEMRYRRPTPLRAGVVVRAGVGAGQALVGLPFAQPDVLCGAEHRLRRLDDVLGPGWAAFGVDASDAAWAQVEECGLPDGRRVDVVLDDRSARPRSGRPCITDADGRLEALLGPLRGRFLLLRPDRMVAAVFAPAEGGLVNRRLRQCGMRTFSGAGPDAVSAVGAPVPPGAPGTSAPTRSNGSATVRPVGVLGPDGARPPSPDTYEGGRP